MSRRPLYGWLTADAISLTGTRLSMLALPWFALTTTGSATKTGLIALVETAPMVVLKVLGGPVIDRLGPRRVAISCDVASAGVVALIPTLYAAGALHFGLFLLLVGTGGALRGPGDAAKNALIPQLVERAGVPIERATGLGSMVERSATMLGAAAAGVLIGVLGAPTAIAVDAASFALGAAVLAWSTAGLARPVEHPAAEPYLRQLGEGWDFLRRDRVLVGIVVMVTLTNLIDLAMVGVLTPVWGHERASVGTVGLLLAVFAAFSAVASGLAATYAARLPRYWTYVVCFLVAGVPRFLVLGLDTPLWGVVAVYAAGGFASGFLNPILGAIEFERIPSRLVGRVSSLGSAACYALMPFGGLLGGGLIGGLGLTGAMLVCGAAYFVVTMFPALDPTWREIDRRPARPAGGLIATAAGAPAAESLSERTTAPAR
ncbi:MFS transporter [Nocardioides sp. KR10-350]|uniref:MFS transporter n=1 Tax=Nocardioides cheoyonin TaxID=3156615 RepID=UPI0032B48DEC